MWLKPYLLLSLTAMLLSSCGYRFGKGDLAERYSSVCIPFVEGDDEGFFTTALIRAVTERSGLAYRTGSAALALKVCLFEPIDSNIGFIYAPDEEDGGISRIVVANEARLMMGAKVSLVDRQTGCCVLGPIEMRTFLDYDFQPDLSNIDENAFSLGQLEWHNLAQEEALCPLYTLLAEKIADYISNAW